MANTPHRIIALWGHPRSLSTAFSRIMMERGDFTIVHEPFSHLYYQQMDPNEVNYTPTEEVPQSYDAIKKNLFAEAQTQAILFKDMCYHCNRYFLEDTDFIQSIQHSFLIRDPKKSIPSHYHMNPKVTLEEIGYEAQYETFAKVLDVTGTVPPVIDADDLQTNPESITQQFCEALNLEWKPEALHWEAKQPKEWEAWKGWHQEASQSTSIHKKEKQYEVHTENNSLLKEYYEHHLPFYEKLHAHRLIHKD